MMLLFLVSGVYFVSATDLVLFRERDRDLVGSVVSTDELQK